MSKYWSQTASGRAFDYEECTAADVCIEDIAASLSKICRFNGHTRAGCFYSVAQHSVIVSQLCQAENALVGLLHDAHEVYVQDVIRPLQYYYGGIGNGRAAGMFSRVQAALCAHFRLPALSALPPDVVEADNRMLATEKRHIMAPCTRSWELPWEPYDEISHIAPWDWREAERRFMERYVELTRLR